MRIIALVKSLEHVCCRYRLAAYRPFLEQAGHQLELRPWPKTWWARLHLQRWIGRTDAIILQRILPSPRQLDQLRQACQFFLYDFDDAVFIRDSFAPRGHACSRQARAFARVVRSAHAVIAGNAYLQEKANTWTQSDTTHRIPTCIDPALYPLAEHSRRGPAQLVWIGSASTLQGLEQMLPILENLGKSRPGLHLKIICDRFLNLHHLPVICRPWAKDQEGIELASADIGISWVPDDPWSLGKCGLKIIQYMAAGLPVVANPVGLQANLVRDGETGFLARTPREWEQAIDRLAADPELRRRLGQAGRALVETQYHVAQGASRWLALLDRLQESSPPYNLQPSWIES